MKLEDPSPGAVVRGFLAAATVVFAVAGFLGGADPRWFAASGAFGLMWFAWDFLVSHLFSPFGEWFSRTWSDGGGGGDAANLRPTLDDTIRLLESHLRREVARSVVVQAAIRLEEIYRTIKKDPARAREVIVRARELVPDAEEFARYQSGLGNQ